MFDNVRDIYFAGHHLTRDLIGNVAPLTAVCALVTLGSPSAREFALTVFQSHLAGIGFWTFVLILMAYLIIAYFIGAIANVAGNMLHRWWQRFRWGKDTSYTYWYRKNEGGINSLYDRFFPGEFGALASGAAVTPTDKINAIKEYLRTVNPGGYIETYRQFLKVDIVRACHIGLLNRANLVGHRKSD